MADDFKIDIEWEGLDEFIMLLESFSPAVEAEMIKQMDRYRLQLERATKALTPVLTNELTKSITSSQVMRNPGEYFFTIGSDLPYALEIHEHMGNWGERTLAKANFRGHAPGRKYLENAIRLTEADWDKMMEAAIDNTIRKGRF